MGAVLILPSAFFFIAVSQLYLLILGSHRTRGVRTAFLLTGVGSCAWMVLGMELLSVFNALSSMAIAVFWLLTSIALLVWGLRIKRLLRGWERVKQAARDLSRVDWLLLSLFGAASTILLLVTLVSPPNNYDSLMYHLARVAHWAQNGSLGHFVTANEQQLYMPPLAEMAILNLRLVWGNDLLAGLVQWFSMLGSVAGVSLMVGLMGHSRKYQWVAGGAAFAIPMGILQSTSTQNDYVAAFFAVCLAALVLKSKVDPERDASTWAWIGLATGLGVLTKGTFVVYAAPFLVWYFLPLPGKKQRWGWVARGLGIVLLMGLVNLGHWSRNMATYGGILGSTEDLSRFIRVVQVDSTIEEPQADQPGVEESSGSVNTPLAILDEWRQKLASMMVWHLITPVGAWNNRWIGFVHGHPGWFPPEYVNNIEWAAWNHEDTAGNPLHLVLVPITAAIVLIRRKRLQGHEEIPYMAATLLTFPLLAIIIANSPYLWSVRFHLTFFVLWAPVIGLASATLFERRWFVVLITIGFLVASTPWILFNNTRPVIGLPPWPTRIESVFSATKLQIITAFDPNGLEFYSELRQKLHSDACQVIGLQIDSTDPEYLYWWLVDAPQSGVRVEVVEAYEHLERYVDPEFQPCLILCTTCGGRQELLGMQRWWEGGNVVLYAK